MELGSVLVALGDKPTMAIFRSIQICIYLNFKSCALCLRGVREFLLLDHIYIMILIHYFIVIFC